MEPTKGYKVEMSLKGRWLWVVQSPFRTLAEAENYIAEQERLDLRDNRVPTPYRVADYK